MRLVGPYGENVSVDNIESPADSRVEWQILQDSGNDDIVRLKVGVSTTEGSARPRVIYEELHVYARAGESLVRVDITVSAMLVDAE